MEYKLLITASMLIVIAILVIAIILLLANLGAYFTKIAQGSTVFISVGESLKKIWPNVGGYKMSSAQDLGGRHWLIPEKDEKERMRAFFYSSLPGTVWFQKWLWGTFGVKFISWFWPHVNVHRFDIRKGGRRRIEARADVGPDAFLRSRVIDSPEPTIVDSLLFIVPRPVYLEGVEIAGDNSRINLLLLPVYRQVIPSLPVYYLKGDFFTLLDAAIEATVVDFFASYRVGKKPLTYAGWLKITKAGEGSPLEQHLHGFNVSKAYRDNLEGKGGAEELIAYIDELTHRRPSEISGENVSGIIPIGIVPRFGFALVSFRIVEWEVHSSTVALAKSLLEKETQRHTAEGVRQKALGEGDAIETLADAQSSRYQKLVNALVEKRVTPDAAALVIQTQLRTENIRDSKVTTYVEGGASASVMVSSSPKKED